MDDRLTSRRRASEVCLALALLSAGAAGAATGSPDVHDVVRRPWLFKDARGELALARVRGEREVLVVIAAAKGRAARVARKIHDLGGVVRYRDDDVDYLRARTPLDAVDELSRHPDVMALDLSVEGKLLTYDLVAARGPVIVGMPKAAVDTDAADSQARPCPPADSPLRWPYSPLPAMGAAAFRADNPSFDGRGVTLALLDGTPDHRLPELQDAMTLDGRPVRKLLDVVSVTDPEDEPEGAGEWVSMTPAVSGEDGVVQIAGRSYRAPRAGEFHVGVFHEDAFQRGVGGDLNFDGNPAGSSRAFAVLWDRTTNEVWVDANQNHRFDDEPALSDFRESSTYGSLGTDDPDTPIRESIAFTVQTDPARNLVAINPGYYRHSTNVIGAAIGSRGEDGRFEGVAPGARLVSIHKGSSAYGHIEGAIRAMKDPLVDIVVIEQHSTLDDTYGPRDGRLVASIVLERLVARHGKPVLIPASNMPVLAAVTDIGMARGVIAVGGQQSSENLRINRGVTALQADNMHGASSFGPGGDGRLKPDVIAPTDLLSTTVGYAPPRRFGPGNCYELPVGYTISNGTSTAAPVAAAAVALLISAAKQHGVRYDAERIRHALTMGARFAPGLPAYKQGNGVVNVANAWEILRALDGQDPPPIITSSAPVRTAFSHLLPVPHRGSGLFEVADWRPGERHDRVVVLTRTTGAKEPLTYAVRLEGNDGTFSAPLSVELPLGEPVELPITVHPVKPGVHSALLTLDHPSVPGHAYRTLLTVVSARVLEPANGFAVEERVPLAVAGQTHTFVRVPEQAEALEVELQAPDGSAMLHLRTPDGRHRGWVIAANEETRKLSIPAPQGGVWELLLNSRSVPDASAPTRDATTVTLRVVARMTADAGGDAASRAHVVAAERGVISAGEQHVYEIEVPAGATQLVAHLRPRGGAAADANDLDLYAFDCTKDQCEAVMADARIGSVETLRIDRPAAGRWKLVVDAFHVAGERKYGYALTTGVSR